jgi:branched-chain amino acid transport system substrate-binding protein
MNHLIKLLILFVIVFCFGSCDRKPAIEPSGKTIKVGIIAPFSGSDYAKGKEAFKGIKAAMQLQPYLQNGDGIELVVEDDQDKSALSLKALEKLTQVDNVSAVITFSSSGKVLALASVADTYQTPILAALATHPDITEHNDFISQLCLDDTIQGTITALFVRDELLFDEVAVFSNPHSKYSSNLATEFKRKFKSLGGEITDDVFLTEKTEDLAGILKSVLAKKPELLYLPVSAKNVLRIVKETKKLAWKPKMMGSDGLISTIIIQHREESYILEGMMATDFFAHGMPLTPLGKKAKEQIRDKFKGKATTYSALGFEGYAILLNAMNRCSDTKDRECINNQIRSTTNFKGVAGNITIRPNGKAERSFCINSIKAAGLSKFIVKVY